MRAAMFCSLANQLLVAVRIKAVRKEELDHSQDDPGEVAPVPHPIELPELKQHPQQQDQARAEADKHKRKDGQDDKKRSGEKTTQTLRDQRENAPCGRSERPSDA